MCSPPAPGMNVGLSIHSYIEAKFISRDQRTFLIANVHLWEWTQVNKLNPEPCASPPRPSNFSNYSLLSTTLSTKMTGISLHMQWSWTSQSLGSIFKENNYFLVLIKLHALILILRPILNFTPRGKLWPQGRRCPQGVNFFPWGWSYLLGVKLSVSILLKSREGSLLGLNKRVNIPSRGQI
jgi:hypothetical protein